MPTIRVMAMLASTSGLPEDVSINTWHFQTAVSTTPYADIADSLTTFYNAFRPYFSNDVPNTGHRFKMYDLADSTPRAPVYDEPFALTGTVSSTALPPEMAICLSFQAIRASGFPQARRRGRVYMGPLGRQQVSDGDPRPAQGMLDALADAAEALLAESNLASDWNWVVYSEANNNTVNVDNGWVDNAFDVQRRRGVAPTSRVEWP